MFRSLIVRYGVHAVLVFIVFGAIGIYTSELDVRLSNLPIDYSKLNQLELVSPRRDSSLINSVVLPSDSNILSDSITRNINIRTHIPSRPRQDVITYNVRAEMRKPPLVNDEDWPEFDQEFHDLLIWGTTKDLLPTIGKSGTADRHRETFEQRMLDFAAEKNHRPAAIHVFADIQSYVGTQNRPGRPQIAGVDFGLASN